MTPPRSLETPLSPAPESPAADPERAPAPAAPSVPFPASRLELPPSPAAWGPEGPVPHPRDLLEAPASVVEPPPGGQTWPQVRTSRLRPLLWRAMPRLVVARRLRRTTRPTVLLTFDDGPQPEVTPRVLDVLERHGARAVFFLVGRYLRGSPALARQIVERGHVIGNHSHLHHNRRYVDERPPFRLYLDDARRCQETIHRVAGVWPRLFRPPGGKVTPTTVLVPFLLGLKCVHWSLDSHDWRFRTSREARTGAAQVLGRTRPGDIVLFHDNRSTSVELLEIVLDGLTMRGFDLSAGLDAL